MPRELTIFAAQYLVFIDAVLAAVVIVWNIRSWSQPKLVQYAGVAVLLLVLSYGFATIAGAVYSDPRPFTVDHVKPLISHAADNGFPSDHALLAAAVVALVLIVAPAWSVPFAVLAILVDWARVGAGIHHVSDVVGSTLLVALATLLALLAGHVVSSRLASRFPEATGGAWNRGAASVGSVKQRREL